MTQVVFKASGCFARVYTVESQVLKKTIAIKHARHTRTKRMRLYLPTIHTFVTDTVAQWFKHEHDMMCQAYTALPPLWRVATFSSYNDGMRMFRTQYSQGCAFAMEAVPTTWASRCDPLRQCHVRDMLMQACAVLTYLHNAHVVHGDITATNCGIRPWRTLSSWYTSRTPLVQWQLCGVPNVTWTLPTNTDASVGVLALLDYGCAINIQRLDTLTRARARRVDYKGVASVLQLRSRYPTLYAWFTRWCYKVEEQRALGVHPRIRTRFI